MEEDYDMYDMEYDEEEDTEDEKPKIEAIIEDHEE